MVTYLRDWFKKPYGWEGKIQVESYVKSRGRAVFWMFIIVIILIAVLELDKQFNISGFLEYSANLSIVKKDEVNERTLLNISGFLEYSANLSMVKKDEVNERTLLSITK